MQKIKMMDSKLNFSNLYEALYNKMDRENERDIKDLNRLKEELEDLVKDKLSIEGKIKRNLYQQSIKEEEIKQNEIEMTQLVWTQGINR